MARPPGRKTPKFIRVYLSLPDLDLLHAAAVHANLPVSEWARCILIPAALKHKPPAKIPTPIPDPPINLSHSQVHKTTPPKLDLCPFCRPGGRPICVECRAKAADLNRS